MKKPKTPKVQIVIVKDGKSYTRHVKDGQIRSLDCPHGIRCSKCFVERS